MTGPNRRPPESIHGARSRRVELGEAADAMEACLARPASDPEWVARTAGALDALRVAFAEHVDEVERPEGLLQRLVEDAPRLANGVNRLKAEHVEIDGQFTHVGEVICLCGRNCGHTDTGLVRERTVDVLKSISRHRQAGADAVYEAYSVDIGGG